ncbi:hypothetical protein OFO93_40970, partial [Escherichia coli]|nr:hypothetical protein [Escherichia coli]
SQHKQKQWRRRSLQHLLQRLKESYASSLFYSPWIGYPICRVVLIFHGISCFEVIIGDRKTYRQNKKAN